MGLPETCDEISFVYLKGDRLYTADDETLYVFSMSDLTSSIATYPVGDLCFSGMIIDDRLYLGGNHKLHLFKVSTSITQPLKPAPEITTENWVYKLLRVGNELLLG